jgi:CheY-like chemotaxis protein
MVRVNEVVDKGAMLCDRLLTYAGRSVRKNDVCHINAVVRETVQIIEAVRTDCTVTLHLVDDRLPVWGDAAQLSQVLMNLLTNAADSIDGADGQIEVHTSVGRHTSHPARALQLRADTDYAFILVRDNGCGIADEAQDRIFDPFYSSKGDGRGIGLAAVSGIVKDHLGDIAFHSEISAGTTFVVALPISAAQCQPVLTQGALLMPVTRHRVLVVDDDEMVRTSTKMLLETADIPVTTAVGGADALEIIEREGDVFGSVLIDQTMPGMSGLETCRQLRARGIPSPVILMSGYSAVTIDEELDQVTFLSKPCTRHELLQAVSDAAESVKGTANGVRPIDALQRMTLICGHGGSAKARHPLAPASPNPPRRVENWSPSSSFDSFHSRDLQTGYGALQ